VDITATAERPAGSADEQLIERARHGDAAAFDALVRGRIDRCYRLAWSILLNDADAADATQDAFVSAWRQLPRLRDPRAFDGWLNRIVANSPEWGGDTAFDSAKCRSARSRVRRHPQNHRPIPSNRMRSTGSPTSMPSAGRSIGCANRNA
jgi:hypothetical protein